MSYWLKVACQSVSRTCESKFLEFLLYVSSSAP